jgi:hypothetical protein
VFKVCRGFLKQLSISVNRAWNTFFIKIETTFTMSKIGSHVLIWLVKDIGVHSQGKYQEQVFHSCLGA